MHFDPYDGRDPREIAAYSVAEAAHYLSIPETTVRSWVSGDSQVAGNRRRSRIHLLSFVDLLKLFMLGATRRRDALQAHLKRIERDGKGLAIKLYPFTRPVSAAAPKFVVIDPRMAFGRPVIAGSRIPTTDVFERFKAGDSLDILVAEYGRSTDEIQEAIRYEADRAA